MFSRNVRSLMLLILLASLALNACGPRTEQASQVDAEPVTLKVALIPVLDKLPMLVAQKEGLYEKYGVKVEFIPVSSAPERDQLVASGQVDGMLNEALSTMFFNKDEVRVQIVRYARAATSSSALFRILASGNSEIDSLEKLKGAPIGVSEGTVIEYLTNRILEAEGFSAAEINTVAVPDISARMTLLANGELKAAMLPEPLSSLAILQGAHEIIDDTAHPEYSFSVITFRKEVIDQHPEAIRAFLFAVEEATNRINADPNEWKNLLVEEKMLPEPLVESFQVPQFVQSGVPSLDQWNDQMAWAREKGLLDRDVDYQGTVNPAFLP